MTGLAQLILAQCIMVSVEMRGFKYKGCAGGDSRAEHQQETFTEKGQECDPNGTMLQNEVACRGRILI